MWFIFIYGVQFVYSSFFGLRSSDDIAGFMGSYCLYCLCGSFCLCCSGLNLLPPKLKNTKFHQTYNSLLRSSVFGLPASVFCLPSSNFRLRSSDFRLPSSVFRRYCRVYGFILFILFMWFILFMLFGPKPFATKTQKHQISPNIQLFTSVFGLRSSNFRLRSSVFRRYCRVYGFILFILFMWFILFMLFGPKPFATKTQKHQISPNIQLFTSVFGLRSSNFRLRSSVFRMFQCFSVGGLWGSYCLCGLWVHFVYVVRA